MMPCAYLYTLVFGYLCLLFWAIQPIAAMETSVEANVNLDPPVVTATMRESVVLPCRLPRGWITQNYEVQWYKMTPGPAGARNEAITISSPALSTRFSHTEDKASLRIAQVAAEDVGVYFCDATLRQGEFLEKFRGNDTELRVLDVINRKPTVETATRGESFTLHCNLPAWVIQKYSVQWYRTPGPGGVVTSISTPALPPRFSLMKGEFLNLLIAPVAMEDAGVYFCETRTVPGEPQFRGAGTELQIPGLESSGRANVTVVTATRGGSVILPCRISWGGTTYQNVEWYRTPGPAGARDEPQGQGDAAVISSPALPPRFSHMEEEDKASLQITPVAAEDEGVYFCVMGEFRGTGSELRVLAPPSAPQLFLQAPPDLWSEQWNLFCVMRGFHSNEVRLSWMQDGAESELQDCTPGSADPGPVQSNGTVRQNLTLEENDDSAPNGSLPVSLAIQRCIYVNDSSGQGPYLLSVLPLSLGPTVSVTYTCAVRDHPMLPTVSFKWVVRTNQCPARNITGMATSCECGFGVTTARSDCSFENNTVIDSWFIQSPEPPSSEVIRRLNIFKICFLSGLTLVLSVAALYSRLKKREP